MGLSERKDAAVTYFAAPVSYECTAFMKFVADIKISSLFTFQVKSAISEEHQISGGAARFLSAFWGNF